MYITFKFIIFFYIFLTGYLPIISMQYCPINIVIFNRKRLSSLSINSSSLFLDRFSKAFFIHKLKKLPYNYSPGSDDTKFYITGQLNFTYTKFHGRIIKWTQHIGFLTLAGMARVVEGIHGNDSKRRVARILYL